MKYNRKDLTERDVCKRCGKDLRQVNEIHVVEGYHYCSKECAVDDQTDIIIASAKQQAIEWYRDCAEVVTPMDIGIVREDIVEVYSKEYDLTTIYKDRYYGEKPISTEVVGFYHGEPNEIDTMQFIGSLKATYEL